jgi:hypothetical protein
MDTFPASAQAANGECREVYCVPKWYAYSGQRATIVPGSERGNKLEGGFHGNLTVDLKLLRKAKAPLIRVSRADLGDPIEMEEIFNG